MLIKHQNESLEKSELAMTQDRQEELSRTHKENWNVNGREGSALARGISLNNPVLSNPHPQDPIQTTNLKTVLNCAGNKADSSKKTTE